MRTYLTLLFLLMAATAFGQLPDPAQAGPLSYTSFDTTFTDTAYSNTDISATLYYPDSVTGDYPLVVFGHGFTVSYTFYTNWYEHLASWGYIVAALDEQNGFNISHPEFGQQMLGTIDMVSGQDAAAGSRLNGLWNGKSATMGHSMGGGSALIAAVDGGALVDAVIGLAPAETDPSVIDDMQDITADMLIISGRGDSVTPESSVQIPMYNAATTGKLWVSLLEGGHCNFADGNSGTCEFGATTVGDAGTLSYADQQALAFTYATPFLEYFLKDETQWDEYVCGTYASTDSEVEHETNYDCNPVSARQSAVSTDVQLYPNPAANVLNISEQSVRPLHAEKLVCINTIGQQVVLNAETTSTSLQIDISALPTGVYSLQHDGEYLGRFVKQ